MFGNRLERNSQYTWINNQWEITDNVRLTLEAMLKHSLYLLIRGDIQRVTDRASPFTPQTANILVAGESLMVSQPRSM